MCIRDSRGYELTGNEQLIVLFTNKSNKDVAYQFNINGYLTEKTYVYCADTLKEEMRDALEPEQKVPAVSYTHLDVYKRQEEIIRRFAPPVYRSDSIFTDREESNHAE